MTELFIKTLKKFQISKFTYDVLFNYSSSTLNINGGVTIIVLRICHGEPNSNLRRGY